MAHSSVDNQTLIDQAIKLAGRDQPVYAAEVSGRLVTLHFPYDTIVIDVSPAMQQGINTSPPPEPEHITTTPVPQQSQPIGRKPGAAAHRRAK